MLKVLSLSVLWSYVPNSHLINNRCPELDWTSSVGCSKDQQAGGQKV